MAPHRWRQVQHRYQLWRGEVFCTPCKWYAVHNWLCYNQGECRTSRPIARKPSSPHAWVHRIASKRSPRTQLCRKNCNPSSQTLLFLHHTWYNSFSFSNLQYRNCDKTSLQAASLAAYLLCRLTTSGWLRNVHMHPQTKSAGSGKRNTSMC